jgi:hypothetical protein
MTCLNNVGFQPFANRNRPIRLNINNNWLSGVPEPFRVLLKKASEKRGNTAKSIRLLPSPVV